jgi:hypothetical protein
VETVPRHRFVPDFYLPADERDRQGLTVWEPVAPELDHSRWLAAAYSGTTLITQFDGDDPNWKAPQVRHGGAPTSSSTLPSLVVRMWARTCSNDLEGSAGPVLALLANVCDSRRAGGYDDDLVAGHALRRPAAFARRPHGWGGSTRRS